MAEKTIKNKLLYQIIALLGVLFGLFFLGNALIMWLGSIVVTPIGFLFGLGEANSYNTLLEQLTNLWWHVVPGIAGAGLCIVFQVPAILLLWGSVKLWQRTKVPEEASAS